VCGNDWRRGVVGDGGRDRAVAGHQMTMGTASTMTSIAETLGLTLPGAALNPGGRCKSFTPRYRLRPPHRRDGLGESETTRHRHAES
jgi:hypothetical protein